MLDMLMENKIAVVVVGLIIAGGAWYMLSGSGATEPILVTEDLSSPVAEADRGLVATLLQLRSVRLDGTIFSDPAFKSLRDFGSQIIAEPVGRQNPFAPFEGQANVQGAAAAGANTPQGAAKTLPKTAPKAPAQSE